MAAVKSLTFISIISQPIDSVLLLKHLSYKQVSNNKKTLKLLFCPMCLTEVNNK